MYLGPQPSDVPLTQEQLAAGDKRFARLDLANSGIYKNGFINGGFEVWQRKFSASSLSEFVADRWFFQATTVSCGFGRVIPSYDNANVSIAAARLSVGGDLNATSGICRFYQAIEGVRTYSGKRVRVSALIRRVSGPERDIVVEGAQFFGSGGSPSATVYGIMPVPGQRRRRPSTVFERHSWVIDVPSIAGKTAGTDGNDWITFSFWAGAGSQYNDRTDNLGVPPSITVFDFADVMVHEVVPGHGDPILPFLQRHHAEEMALCQRYFNRQQVSIIGTGNGEGAGGFVGTWVAFNTRMRVSPSVSNIVVSENSNWLAQPVFTVYPDGTRAYGTSAGPGSSYWSAVADFTAEL